MIEYNETTVTKERDRDEYWGYWEQCDTCHKHMREGAVFCPTCGRRVNRKKKDE